MSTEEAIQYVEQLLNELTDSPMLPDAIAAAKEGTKLRHLAFWWFELERQGVDMQATFPMQRAED